MNKAGWQLKRLGDVCIFDKLQGVHQNLPYVGLEHIESQTARFIGSTEPVSVKSATFRFFSKHVLYGRLRPYLNKALAPDFDGHCSTEIFPIKPNPELSREYLLYWFLADETTDRINATCTGARMPRADMNEVLEFYFPLPPLPEQRRIVAILDDAFDGIATAKANAEKNLQNARALFESHLQSVFTEAWQAGNLVTLSDLATDISDGDHMPPPKSETGVPFITIGNIEKDKRRIDFSDTFKVPRDYFDGLKSNKKPQAGDVLYTVTGSFGIPVLVRDGVEFCFQRHIGLVRPKPEVASDWLYYLLMSPQVFRQANEGATGTAQKTVSLKLLRSFQVPTLPLAQQLADVAKLDAIAEETQRLASLYQQKLTALDTLKKSLLHQAFSGQL
jgi:type I restriction enzyme S subunit